MKAKILLIVLPQTEIGQCMLTPTSFEHIHRLATIWQDAGYTVELLNAETARLNLFEVVRETRRQAPHSVWIMNAETGSVHALVLVLIAMLRSALPALPVIYKNRVFHHCIGQAKVFSTTMSLIKSALQNTYHGKTSAPGYSTSSSSHHTSWYR